MSEIDNGKVKKYKISALGRFLIYCDALSPSYDLKP